MVKFIDVVSFVLIVHSVYCIFIDDKVLHVLLRYISILPSKGSLPELPPRALPVPSSHDTSSSQSDDDTLQDENDSTEPKQELIKDSSPLTIEDCTEEDATDFPSNIILVRARSPDSNEVTNFISGERAQATSNFQVTNFMNSRNAEITEKSKFGIDNLSFEEEETVPRSPILIRRHNAGMESQNSGTSTPKGMEQMQKFLASSRSIF